MFVWVALEGATDFVDNDEERTMLEGIAGRVYQKILIFNNNNGGDVVF